MLRAKLRPTFKHARTPSAASAVVRPPRPPPIRIGSLAAGVVPAFNEVEDHRPWVELRAKPVAVQQLALERGEEALAERVVVVIAHAAHRGADAGFLTPAAGADRIGWMWCWINWPET